MSEQKLLDPDFMRTLENMSFVSRKVFRGLLKGERRSKKKGISIEFADYREYVPGDDLRFLDWNILGRLNKLLLRLFQEEEDLNLYFLIDNSKSMSFGSPTKYTYAKKIAASLGYIALNNLDRIAVGIFDRELKHIYPLSRGKKHVWKLLNFLENAPEGGETDMHNAFRAFPIRFRHSGIVVIISDFLDVQGLEKAYKFFSPRSYEVIAIQVLAEEEIEPTLTGDIKLVDSENGATTDLSISADLLQRYQFVLSGFMQQLSDYCSRNGIFYLYTSNQAPIEDLLLRYLKKLGIVK
ncbi:DUF58 domain-containing protein [Candidatus Uabimicrobium amorphum]|uniref:DUF58 domain-containing protein n=1 Tax=Uabimicrobium amorphum TaxID=2596890 RepID=A0A5S9IIS4_UABAM|nr:DUF58 domain-containing protein [Candidatus Uabimicrobium amorphum]BBM82573.1 hypothetical protein UABAM_00916 [Candidatus Uabimicrobium amorphum]